MSISAEVEIIGGERTAPYVAWDKASGLGLGELIKRIILARIASGLTLRGRPFAAYRGDYGESRGAVDLHETGQMPSNIQVRPARRKVTIIFRAKYSDAVDTRRPFAGMSVKETDGPVMDAVLDAVDRSLAAWAGKGGGIHGG